MGMSTPNRMSSMPAIVRRATTGGNSLPGIARLHQAR
jgi:hypothetical protein